MSPTRENSAEVNEHASAEVADDELVGIKRVVGNLRRKFHVASGAVIIFNLNHRKIAFVFEKPIIFSQKRMRDG